MQTVTKKDNFKAWVDKTNLIPEVHGELVNLNTIDKSDIVNSINELYVILTTGYLSNVVQDLSPELGNNLDLNNYDIIGTGDINITGSYTGGLASAVTATTQSTANNSTFIATTEFADAEIAAAMASGLTWGGNFSGAIGNAQIAGDSVGIPEIDKSTSYSYSELQFFGTDGSGQLTFINTTELGAIGGQDLSGSISDLEILSDTIGIDELNLVDGSDGHLITTDGSGTITFNPSVTESLITTTAGDQVFNVNYIVGMIVVYLNGIKLINGQDFTATNGTTVSLVTAILVTGTTIDFQTYGM